MVGSGYKGSRTGEVHGFLQAYAHPVRELALELRRHVFETRPSVAEAVRPGWKLIGYRTEAGAYFGFVAPASGYVDLGFEYGFLMVDAGELLPRGEQVRAALTAGQSDPGCHATIGFGSCRARRPGPGWPGPAPDGARPACRQDSSPARQHLTTPESYVSWVQATPRWMRAKSKNTR